MKLVKNDDGSWRSWDSLRDDRTDKVETINVVPVESLKEFDQYLIRSIFEERNNSHAGVPGAHRVVDALRCVRKRLDSLFERH